MLSTDSTRVFLTLCLRGRRDPAALDTARDLARGPAFDWEAAQAAAHRQFLSPLLYHILNGRDIVPAPVEAALRAAHDYTARRNLYLAHALDAALACLDAEGLPAVVLKGAALARLVYPSPAVRPLRDLDLLVRPEAVPAALRALGPLGYAPIDAETHPGAAVTYENEVRLRRPGSLPVLLELHWSLIDSPYYQRKLPTDWFWESALPFPGGPASALALGPEAQLLYLCAHVRLHHGGDELLWLHDVAEVLFVYEAQIDWALVLSLAQAHDLTLPTREILSRVAAEWGAPIPGETLERLQALRPSAAESQVYSRLTAENRTVARRLWADLASISGWKVRLAFAWSNLFPSPAYMRRRYRISHRLVLPLYYPYRWFLGLRGLLPF